MLKTMIFSLLFILSGVLASLETVSDDDLLKLIKNEKYVVVLFCMFFIYLV